MSYISVTSYIQLEQLIINRWCAI